MVENELDESLIDLRDPKAVAEFKVSLPRAYGVVKIARKGDYAPPGKMQIDVLCPFCWRTHRHGYDPMMIIQWRQAHCPTGAGGTYLLVPCTKEEFAFHKKGAPRLSRPWWLKGGKL